MEYTPWKKERGYIIMLNFTVGPVQANQVVCEIGAEQVPYFRTAEFSQLMLENERYMKKFSKAAGDARVVFITGSGTAAMEATVMNTLSEKDKALIVNGGSFGHRFVLLCKRHHIPFTEIKLEIGQALKEEMLKSFDGKGYTAFLVNIDETSTGTLYDMNMISRFCKKNNLYLIADSISSFLADPFDMEKLDVDVMITGSQKALACPPGISIIVLSSKAVKRVNEAECSCMYFDLKDALKNAERGQTPFTPAVGILRQIHARLEEIDRTGGVEAEQKRIAVLAQYFREKIRKFPFEFVSESMSNAVTSLHPTTTSANDIFLRLKDEYNIWICPNGGDLKDRIFRVGHLGALTKKDYDKLIAAFEDLHERNLI